MYWSIVPVPGDCEDGEVGGMKCGWQEKLKYSEKTYPSAILSTTNPTCHTRARTRAAAVGSQRLTASAMAQPNRKVNRILHKLSANGSIALSGTRTHDSSVRESEDSPRVTPRGHCYRHVHLQGGYSYGRTLQLLKITRVKIVAKT
jgi:hypothetical protein